MLPQKELEHYCQYIKDELGIELTWSEKAALSHYVESFFRAAKEGRLIAVYGSEALSVFKLDYFGINVGSIDQFPIGDEPLKEYCKRNIQFWREERSLI